MSFSQGDPFGRGGAGGSGGSGGSTPDWAALAEESERKRASKRRWLMIGGGALATVAVAGIVAVAVVSENGDPEDKPSQSLPTPEDLPSSPPQPEPTFEKELPPAPPQDYLKNPEKDKAPLDTGTLFPDTTITVNGREYTREAVDSTKKCTASAQGDLGPVLEKNDCREMFRATFVRDGLAFTLGIAVFDSEKDASAVKSGYEPNVESLSGGDVPTYCRTVVCRTTVNSLGRYGLFTISGHTDGKPAGDDDEPAKQVAVDGSNYGYSRLIDRGERQAAADASAG
ncbi:hypothetical protein RM572_17715 [Streptomyces sp. DSM 42041]|uniref:Peptidylprolyl isomerase n=1 Tax=Streptomyces hazeniae TaxID=3075538 RepID=A0ABU2NUD0_9ACTN|nr:hypothetical protein [Streptomyces sp. DSM 42041]MDT0380594.1 hypothetical protein [Streptomyces sp. DSM 42041]